MLGKYRHQCLSELRILITWQPFSDIAQIEFIFYHFEEILTLFFLLDASHYEFVMRCNSSSEKENLSLIHI